MIYQIIVIASILTYIIDFAMIPEYIKRWLYYRIYSKDTPYKPYSIKPFDCSGCLSFWTALIYFSITTTIYTAIPLAFITGVVALVIRKLIV